jgi:hypothetical protein
MPALQIVNADQRRLYVRLVRKDEFYGDNDDLRHASDEPLLEFFDASPPHRSDGNGLGYYTGVRCAVSVLFATAFEQGSEADTLFNESLPMWSVSPENIAAIQTWLQQQLSHEEQSFFNNTAELVQTPPPTAVNHAPPFAPSLHASLHQVLALLDNLEQSDESWRHGDVSLRLHVLSAKQSILQALAASARHPPI